MDINKKLIQQLNEKVSRNTTKSLVSSCSTALKNKKEKYIPRVFLLFDLIL